MHATDAGLVINALSGLFMIALGIIVLTVRWGRRDNRGFALFAIPFGFTWILENIWGPSGRHEWPLVLLTIGGLLTLSAVGLVLLGGAFHRSTDPSSRRHMRLALIIGIGVFLADIAFFLPTFDAAVLRPQNVVIFVMVGFWFFHAAAWGLLAFLALRYSAHPRGSKEAAGIRLMSLALVLYPAFFAARETVLALDVMGWPRGLVVAGVMLVVAKTSGIASLWLRNAARAPYLAAERWLAWTVVAAALVGVPDAGFGNNHPGFGIARTLGVVILAYAVLRHQLLGIDVKVRWTLSKSSVAAVFIAVFFVASEAAQQYFGDTMGSQYLGIVAAGTLVFAIAPLQRVADRLAERAVPMAPVSSDPSAVERNEATYRRAVQWAFRDRALAQEEERDLVLIAAGLGVGPARAFEIRDEVEREYGDTGRGGR